MLFHTRVDLRTTQGGSKKYKYNCTSQKHYVCEKKTLTLCSAVRMCKMCESETGCNIANISSNKTNIS